MRFIKIFSIMAVTQEILEFSIIAEILEALKLGPLVGAATLIDRFLL
jgi:hypothetical protein